MAEKALAEVAQAYATALGVLELFEARRGEIAVHVSSVPQGEVTNVIRRYLEKHLVEAVWLGEQYLRDRVVEARAALEEAMRFEREMEAAEEEPRVEEESHAEGPEVEEKHEKVVPARKARRHR